MSTELAKAYIQLVPSAEGLSDSISGLLGGEASTAGIDAGNSFSDSFKGSLTSGLATAAKVGAAAIAAVGVAAVGAGTALYNAASATAEYGDNVDKMSQKIGISATAYQEWDYVMKLAGTSVDNLQTGMKILSGVITDAAAGSSNAAEKLEAVGISLEDLNGLSQEQQLDLVIEALQGMESGAERTAAATDLLGRSATDLGPLLNMTAEATAAAKQEAHAYGMVMSDEAVAASAKFEDSLTKLQGTMTGVKNNMMSDFLPGITTVMDGFSDLFSGQDGAPQKISEGVEEIVTTFSEKLPAVIGVVTTVAEGVLKAAPGIISALADGILGALPELIPVAAEVVLQIVTGLIENLPKIVEVAIEIIATLAEGIGEALPDLIPTIVEVMLEIVDTLIENVDKLIDAAIAIITGLAEGLVESLPILIEKIPELIIHIVEAIIDNIPKIVEAGIKLFVALIQDLPTIIATIVAALPELIGAIVAGVISFVGELAKAGLELGANLVRGIWEGITSMVSWLYNLIKGWVKDVIDFIKNLFGIHSPSTVFADMGENLALGLGVGWGDEIGKVRDQIASDMDFGTAHMDYSILGNSSLANSTYGGFGGATGNTTYNFTFNSPESLDPVSAARETKKTMQRLAMGYV